MSVLHPSNSPSIDNISLLVAASWPVHDAVKLERIFKIERAAEQMGKVVLAEAAHCADRSAAIRHLREAVGAAAAAIILEGVS